MTGILLLIYMCRTCNNPNMNKNNPNPRAPGCGEDPSSRRVTLKDIAKELGVSHVTVSMALRNSPRVAEATKERVKAKAEDMGYTPDPMLSALAHYRRTSTRQPIQSSLAWINLWPDPKKLRSYRQFDLYWKGAFETATELGYRLEEFALNEIPIDKVISILKARNVPGMLIPPPTYPVPFDLSSAPWNNYSVIQFGINGDLPAFHSVTSDQLVNGEMAFDRIRAKGYKRIGFCGSQTRLRTFGAGFYWAQYSVPAAERVPLLSFPSSDFDQQFTMLQEWIKRENPDAILVDESQGFDIPQMLTDMGYRIPDDIGLATTNVLDTNIDAGIDQDPEEIGHVAMLALIAQINSGTQGIPPRCHHTLIEGHWVDGHMLPSRD